MGKGDTAILIPLCVALDGRIRCLSLFLVSYAWAAVRYQHLLYYYNQVSQHLLYYL